MLQFTARVALIAESLDDARSCLEEFGEVLEIDDGIELEADLIDDEDQDVGKGD
jgi:hypothetical protein